MFGVIQLPIKNIKQSPHIGAFFILVNQPLKRRLRRVASLVGALSAHGQCPFPNVQSLLPRHSCRSGGYMKYQTKSNIQNYDQCHLQKEVLF